MIEFTHISAEGFCSISTLELDLNTKGTTILRAPNGHGKSSVFSALVWCLYGKNIKGNSNVNTWEKVRPKGYSGTKVEVYFSTSKGIHRVVRCLKYTKEVGGAKGNSRLIYQIDGIAVEDKKKRGIQNLIERDLGMSYNLFINSVMFGQGLKRLIQESGSNQREVFEEVFELGYLSKAQKIAKDKFQEANSNFELANKDYQNTQRNLDSLQENTKSIKEKLKSFESTQQERIDDLNHQISGYKRMIKELNDSLPYSSSSERLQTIREALKDLDKKSLSAKKELKAAQESLGIPLEELVDKIIRLLEKEKYKASLKQLRTLKTAFKTQEKNKKLIIELQEKSAKYSKELNEVKYNEDRISRYEDKVEALKNQVRQYKKDRPDFQSIIDKNNQNIHKLRSESTEQFNRKETYRESAELYKWAYTDPLGSSGIKSYLFSSCLAELNAILETYSEILGFHINFDVALESARKDFVTTIKIGSQIVPFDDLSGGQKQLASLAMAFSMNTMIAQAQGVNIAFLDEVFESLSSDKIEIVVELIRKIYRDKTLFLITHQETIPIPNARVIRVKFEGGISKYEL